MTTPHPTHSPKSMQNVRISVWLHTLPFGGKVLLTLTLVLGAAAFLSRYTTAGHILIGVLLSLYGFTVLFAVTGGFWIRRNRLTAHGIEFDIVDFFLPVRPRENKRILRDCADGGIQSMMYRSPRDTWAYLDVVRGILLALRRPTDTKRRALILGDGSGSIGIGLITNRLADSVELVEPSETIIRAAQRYFVPTIVVPKMAWHQTGAMRFLRTARGTYDVIVVDMFVGVRLAEDVAADTFFSALRKRVSSHGIVIVNFGVVPIPLERFADAIPGMRFLLWHRNCIGLWSPDPQVVRLIRKDPGISAFHLPG